MGICVIGLIIFLLLSIILLYILFVTIYGIHNLEKMSLYWNENKVIQSRKSG